MRAQMPYRRQLRRAWAALGTVGPLERQPAYPVRAKSLQAASPSAQPNSWGPWREYLLRVLAQRQPERQRLRHDRR